MLDLLVWGREASCPAPGMRCSGVPETHGRERDKGFGIKPRAQRKDTAIGDTHGKGARAGGRGGAAANAAPSRQHGPLGLRVTTAAASSC